MQLSTISTALNPFNVSNASAQKYSAHNTPQTNRFTNSQANTAKFGSFAGVMIGLLVAGIAGCFGTVAYQLNKKNDDDTKK